MYFQKQNVLTDRFLKIPTRLDTHLFLFKLEQIDSPNFAF